MTDKKNLLELFPKKEEKVEKKEEKVEEKAEEEAPKIEAKPFFKKKSAEIEFDLSPAEKLAKHVVMIYALKGHGKTSLAFSFPGSHVCLTFDNKSQAIAEEAKETERITVYNGVRYLDKTSGDSWLESADVSWRYINKVLDSLQDKPDWITVDGGEIVHTMLEMVMRSRNNLAPFAGIANKNIWKERRMYIEQLLRKCLDKSKKGVIWTSYIDKDELVEDGDFVTVRDVPRWIDAVLYETDVVIKTERKTGKVGQEFYATVESSKWKVIPETGKVDITGKGIESLAKGEL